jgi:hypothetical protein
MVMLLGKGESFQQLIKKPFPASTSSIVHRAKKKRNIKGEKYKKKHSLAFLPHPRSYQSGDSSDFASHSRTRLRFLNKKNREFLTSLGLKVK